MQKQPGCRLPHDHVVFYGACVAAALEHLHERHYVYRDVKPENLLLDAKGYLRLVDLGFAKECLSKTFTLCGTPEYLAPEMVMVRGHGKGVDWCAPPPPQGIGIGHARPSEERGYLPRACERGLQLACRRGDSHAHVPPLCAGGRSACCCTRW